MLREYLSYRNQSSSIIGKYVIKHIQNLRPEAHKNLLEDLVIKNFQKTFDLLSRFLFFLTEEQMGLF